ncbi:hypothetical protein H5410_037733 [Solanum commersonii]|uniref:RIN4 pathogenic type III effector avirulence factor Avr cleavage site domain-containing protein n=1 Tax=Solanum commersonii TaxID=4109 RepID=A0A9J5Y8Q3_SOLCO|nr:hypothetical protein H5410_037733 [Solanum commersonii]
MLETDNGLETQMEKGQPLPKFGEWDVNDPSSAEGFTVIFNKARNEKKTGGKVDSPPMGDSAYKNKATLGKPQSLLHAALGDDVSLEPDATSVLEHWSCSQDVTSNFAVVFRNIYS